MELCNWLLQGWELHVLPPHNIIEGLPAPLVESLIASIDDGYIYLYALVKSGTYNVRSVGTYDNESLHAIKHGLCHSSGGVPCAHQLENIKSNIILHKQAKSLNGDKKATMLTHLKELMEDYFTYLWESVRNYHGVLLGEMERDHITWQDEAEIQKLRARHAHHHDTPEAQPTSCPGKWLTPSCAQSTKQTIVT